MSTISPSYSCVFMAHAKGRYATSHPLYFYTFFSLHVVINVNYSLPITVPGKTNHEISRFSWLSLIVPKGNRS